MDVKQLLCMWLLLACVYFTNAQEEKRVVKPPPTRFTCRGRAAGYYADMDTGCQVYHMCDGMGRQFSYSCPNTTLFQQRMLVCDHWYMVNCSNAERDYDANLLIGQRDKPFVSDEDMKSRTPRPDVLSVPPNNNYYDGLREAETKFPIHPGNSIAGLADSLSDDNNDLDSDKHRFRSQTSWSIGKVTENNFATKHSRTNKQDRDSVTEASQRVQPTFAPTPSYNIPNDNQVNIPSPSRELSPPFPPATTTESDADRLQSNFKDGNEDPVFTFIKRFDPNVPDSHKTSMTKTEIIDINKELPQGQVSSEEDRTPRRNKNFGNTLNKVRSDKKKGATENTRFDTVNVKPDANIETNNENTGTSQVPVPDVNLLPPKSEYSKIPSTTMGPPIYYEWKWAVPAFGLEPPKENNVTNTTATPQKRTSPARRPFSDITRTTTTPAAPEPLNTEYNISSYFVPDYVFPLDKPHPGYDDTETSLDARVGRPGRSSYGENPNCPQCHPVYLIPGTCEPCVVRR
ncbi:uncharacterized protein LOC106709694 [Papilio machaon]|uniref:uncharacterized protein LOC106709694 n=1 Tax=Papilio machaon TaxID=76193 RepID=UPI001E665767|nr:uncharacterized protein LOC106709694 [Papilio machaon]XP_045535945.1 uncharacterized protein LOC106709694 [Papilio machaon]XP_045535946.1 uncharacterized protein LOC106709694 [Papilio machaon]XP_045535947.1 uncharacterized protein LOC106709694 [Papilio machaon]XP_045535948.1 uncharacterized protein LOC106709694 [Papilio machaon]